MLIKFVLKQHISDSPEPFDSVVAEYVFDGNLFTIGSDAASTIVLDESAAEQAVVIDEGGQLTLINSAEGTILNGRVLRREAMEPLASGDEIKIGNYIISVVADAATLNGNNQSHTNFENKSASVNVLPERSVPVSDNKETNLTAEPNNRKGDSEFAAKKPTRNFADVLNALRTEEDSFYFIVGNGKKEETHLPIEQAEMPIGLNLNGEISCAADQIAALYAIVRKDWSGIVVESQRAGAVFINDELLKTSARLRNGDYLTFNGGRKNNPKTTYLELHEPSSLVALESILETRSRNDIPYRNRNGALNSTAGNIENNSGAQQTIPIFERNFFGYFSFFEVVTMAIGTLITTVLIFLLLEFMF